MEQVCRLCCSERFVNNYIFDEENALHLKMSLYLPIKITKHDKLPQKICDKCSCKVNDFYQFCNETIEAQNTLKSALSICTSSETNQETLGIRNIKDCSLLSKKNLVDQSTQTETHGDEKSLEILSSVNPPEPVVKVKDEPTDLVKQEDDVFDDNYYVSDSSEDMSLMNLKNAKVDQSYNKTKTKSSNSDKKHSLLKKTENGTKKRKKHNLVEDLDNLAPFINAIPKGTSIAVTEGLSPQLKIEMKQEVEEVHPNDLGITMKMYKYKKIKKEKEETQFVCCVCFTESYSKKEMLSHYRSHADVSQLRGSPPPAPPPPAHLPAPCPRCKKEVCEGGWAAHWRHHWELDRRPYRCARCRATFREHTAIFKHGVRCRVKKQKSNDPNELVFVCDVCPETFVNLKCLKAHRNQSHPELASRPLRLACPVCGRGFLHINSLRRHVRGHSGRRDYLCNVCGKGLSSAEHLKSHIQIHENVKPNVCKTCGKAFVKKTNLTMHERVHSGEKPYVCSHCGKCFSQRSTLVIHERYHSGLRPYVCKLCGRGFVARGLLSMHLKVACI